MLVGEEFSLFPQRTVAGNKGKKASQFSPGSIGGSILVWQGSMKTCPLLSVLEVHACLHHTWLSSSCKLCLKCTQILTFSERTRWAARVNYKKWHILGGIQLCITDWLCCWEMCAGSLCCTLFIKWRVGSYIEVLSGHSIKHRSKMGEHQRTTLCKNTESVYS